MAIRLKHSSTYCTYYCTFTNYNWIDLFNITNGYDLVYKWFNHLKEIELADIIVFVIMPNHLHAILHFKKEEFSLNKIIANGKRFMAYEIVERLEKQNDRALLKVLSDKILIYPYVHSTSSFQQVY